MTDLTPAPTPADSPSAEGAPAAVLGDLPTDTTGATTVSVAVEPTQVRRPWRATLRTFVQALIPSVFLAAVVVPQVVQAILDESSSRNIHIPDSLRLALLAISAGVAFVAALLARIMAIPAVEVLLRKVGLGAAPK